ncbi:zinc metalloproteinase-disintegrin-like stejnihagin-B isoform X3 [Gigantopelta aegis]|uniref:zinc metalloproteinase-disintegrin-like stejnihagin-B isoform X3 n=1 Tax=Gigantopelta aegis TaxID=1735272 RepID=UPI001B88B053|nr:zinc metalloproteinase-disintegrin-like stejnihagin-B isoform X3 [Gigantopelta aegis]
MEVMSSTRVAVFIFVTICLLTVYTSADIAYVQISKQSITESRGCRLPKRIGVSVRVDNETLSLELTRNDDVDSNAPLFLFKEDGIEKKKTVVKELLIDNQREAQFQDEAWEAAMTISCYGEDRNVHLELMGILTLHGKEYKLEPKSRNRRGVSRDQEEYTFEKEPVQPIGHDYREAPLYEETVTPNLKKIEKYPILLRLKSASPLRRKRQTPSEYFVDVLTLIDYSIYKRYYDRTESALSAGTRKLLALQNIREYFAYIMNGVNLRYKRITGLTARLVVRLIGYVVAETSSKAPWTENYRVMTSSGGEVDADNVLKFMTKWVPEATLPSSDHVMLFTGYDMYTIGSRPDGSVARSTATSGLAYISTMCRSDGRSISIVEDNGGFQCIDTAAHELGHSLGSRHDGDGNTCKAEDRFIMSGGTYKKTSANLGNPWLFSSCSVTYFNNFLTALMQTRYGINCMTKKISAVNVPTVRDLPGQIYNPDAQCQNIYGSKSRLCQGPNFLNSTSLICVSMYCLDPNTPGTCYQYEAARGTTCGNKKWCINGKCVYSPDAPTADDKCPFGDQSGTAFEGKTCEDFVSGSGASYCYQEVVRGRCCKSCGLHYTGAPGCLYGDKVLGCRKEYCDHIYTDGRRYDANCCGTCGLATTTPGGPTTPVTTVFTQRPTTTAVTQAPTPGTCSDIGGVTFNGKSCADIVAQSPSNCYSDNVKLYCCGTCARVSTGTPGCEYGDRNPSLCSAAIVRGNGCQGLTTICCSSCKKTSGTSGLQASQFIVFIVLLMSVFHIAK